MESEELSLLNKWSGREDLNLRPPVPQTSTNCYKSKIVPTNSSFSANEKVRVCGRQLEPILLAEKSIGHPWVIEMLFWCFLGAAAGGTVIWAKEILKEMDKRAKERSFKP